MAIRRVIDRIDDRPGDETVYMERGGSGAVVTVVIAILALVGLIAFFVVQSNRADAVRAEAVTSAATTVADSASVAGERVAAAADRVAEAAPPQ